MPVNLWDGGVLMAERNIQVNVAGAQGTYGPAAAELAANQGGMVGPDGVRPGLGATLVGMSSSYSTNLDSAAMLNSQGGQFANGFDAADKDGAAKAAAAGPKGQADPTNHPAGAPKVPGADPFTSRLTPNDLLKITNASADDDAWFHEPIYMPPAHDPSQDKAGPGPDSIGRGLAPVHPIANDAGPQSHGTPHMQMVSNDDDDWFHEPIYMPPAYDHSQAHAGPGPDSIGRGLAPVHPI